MPVIFARVALPVTTVLACNPRTDHAAADDPGGRAGSSRPPLFPAAVELVHPIELARLLRANQFLLHLSARDRRGAARL